MKSVRRRGWAITISQPRYTGTSNRLVNRLNSEYGSSLQWRVVRGEAEAVYRVADAGGAAGAGLAGLP